MSQDGSAALTGREQPTDGGRSSLFPSHRRTDSKFGGGDKPVPAASENAANAAPDSAATPSFSLDPYKTQMQERGYCRIATFTLAQVLEIVDDLGIDPAGCAFDVAGWLYVKGTHRAD